MAIKNTSGEEFDHTSLSEVPLEGLGEKAQRVYREELVATYNDVFHPPEEEIPDSEKLPPVQYLEDLGSKRFEIYEDYKYKV